MAPSRRRRCVAPTAVLWPRFGSKDQEPSDKCLKLAKPGLLMKTLDSMLATDEIYTMWEELPQLSDPAVRDEQLCKIATISSSHSSALTCSRCSSKLWRIPRSWTSGPSPHGMTETWAINGASRRARKSSRANEGSKKIEVRTKGVCHSAHSPRIGNPAPGIACQRQCF
jgi:hypothetical protein